MNTAPAVHKSKNGGNAFYVGVRRLLRHPSTRIVAVVVLIAVLATLVPATASADFSDSYLAKLAGSAWGQAKNLLNLANPFALYLTVRNNVIQFVADLVLGFWGFLLGIIGLALNVVINETVLRMGENISGLGVIDSTWTVIRDLANMFFIFILLYIAIGTILQLGSINTKKLLVNLILAAIFINFSMFMTKLIIDASNIVALGFYQNIPAIGTIDQFFGDPSKHGIATVVGNLTRFQTIKNLNPGDPSGGTVPGFAENIVKLQNEPYLILVRALLGLLIMLVLSFVLGTAMFLFITRFVILIFLMILSPLAFAAFALPQLSKISKRWWSTLIDQALFAPVFMVTVFIATSILSSPGFQTMWWRGTSIKDLSFTALIIAPVTESIPLIINFGIVVTFLLASIVIAKKLGAAGAGFATKWGGAITFGAAGVLGRNTFGRAAHHIAESGGLQDMANKGGIRGTIGKTTLLGLRGVAGSTFDARGAVGKDAAKSLGISDVGLGKAGTAGGFTGQLERVKKREEQFYSKEYLEKQKAAEAEKRAAEQDHEVKQKRIHAVEEVAERRTDEEMKKRHPEIEKAQKMLALKDNDVKKNAEAAQRAAESIRTSNPAVLSKVTDAEAKVKDLEERIRRGGGATGFTGVSLAPQLASAQAELKRATDERDRALKRFTDDHRVAIDGEIRDAETTMQSFETERNTLVSSVREDIARKEGTTYGAIEKDFKDSKSRLGEANAAYAKAMGSSDAYTKSVQQRGIVGSAFYAATPGESQNLADELRGMKEPIKDKSKKKGKGGGGLDEIRTHLDELEEELKEAKAKKEGGEES